MIRSMTAFGTARAESAEGSVTIEFRTVNSRFLDINFRLPDDLRMAEGIIREKLNQVVTRGKVDIRLNYVRNKNEVIKTLDQDYLAAIAEQLKTARLAIPDIAAPQLSDLIKGSNGSENDTFSPEIWTAMCQQASTDALADLQANREREGQRLAHMMLECAASVSDIVNDVESHLPQLLTEHQEKLANKLREALQAANPGGFAQITGEELSARIAQETALFSLRIDVAEEVARLRSHISELEHLLHTGEATAKDSKAASKPNGGKQGKNNSGSAGKRLDFLFQEMNREANTLGSKASAISVTRAAIDLKLLIEQMREQAQNIE